MKRLCRACNDWHDIDQPWPGDCAAHFRSNSARSSLGFPSIVSDQMDAVRCMADGKMYESKSQMSAVHKAGGYLEVGNEIDATMKMAARKPARPRVTKTEIAKAMEKVKQGYRPNLPTE